MSNIKVHVEGAPDAVAAFFKEMGQIKLNLSRPSLGEGYSLHPLSAAAREKLESAEIEHGELTQEQKEKIAELVETDPSVIEKVTGKKPGCPKKEKAVEPEVVNPDPEFSELPDVANTATTVEVEPEVEEAPKEKPKSTRSMVQAALKEYGIWLDESKQVEHGGIRPYLYALTKKYGNGAVGTPELEEQYLKNPRFYQYQHTALRFCYYRPLHKTVFPASDTT